MIKKPEMLLVFLSLMTCQGRVPCLLRHDVCRNLASSTFDLYRLLVELKSESLVYYNLCVGEKGRRLFRSKAQ